MPGQVNAINVRAWYVEGGVHPTHKPVYMQHGHIVDPSQSMGERTRVMSQDPNNFNREVEIGSTKGAVERATFTVNNRYLTTHAILLKMARKSCRVDFFTLIGKCGNPQDFYGGGEKHMYFRDGNMNEHSIENYGSFTLDDNNPTNEGVEMDSQEYWEFMKISFEKQAASEAVREIKTIDVCDDVECGDCGDSSDGCQQVLATMVGTGATPGTPPSLLFSDDGGATWSTQSITSLTSTENISDGECIAGDFVIITNEGNELHYTDVYDLYNGEENTWSQVDSGFVLSKGPNAMSAVDVRHLWIVGDGGYVYFAENYKVAVVVQNAGVITTQNLNAVHALDIDNVLAVGNANAVIYTDNGGETWQEATGPSVGINMGTCWMWSARVWFVGEGAGGNGKLWLTTNAGKTWVEKSLPGTYSRIYAIEFVNEAEGFLSAQAGGKSVILRTLLGGYEWIVLPDGKTAVIPDNSYITDLATCQDDSNVVFGAGLADDGSAGIIVAAK